ncbi:MAG: putative peptidoglycan lipid II flippase [Azoarcus sp.]|uniref:Probable lipid II flippase MurJ n=1 Tax=Aromatoleum tolulyticum TaxID=34027 RepID=A0A1N6RKM5_9RHOO|nr:murein biosynthesis integral membrane protein MurJ [Aromatoleum tolulyticum]MCK9984465.1 putative peptidoglycan lipid II flippase [Azoarcus sp.]SIQ29246.1 putative peptidoglycan lipid II flippase [Aromatoleum tolulyticum]
MNLLRALATVSSMTLLSRILGFVRDFVIARTFGAGMATDAFFVAFRLPNLLRRMFAEGAFSQAFVPILAEYKNRQGPEETHKLVSRVATALALAVTAVTAIGIVAAPLIIWVSAPGFADEPDKFALTVELTRITFPYILFMALVALAGGVLNSWSRFAIPAFTPVLLNLSFIGMALFAAPWFDPPVLVLAWAVFIGGILQLALQLRPLARIGLLPRFDLNLSDPGVRRIARLMLPAMLGVSVSQVSLIINTIFASFLESGSVSWLYYADRLMEFPAGLLGAALGTILLPSLSKLHADEQPEAFSSLLDWGLRLTLMLTLPAALALALLAVPLLSTLFQHGAFTATDVQQTRLALVAYSVGLSGLILVKILAPGFYARQDIRTPVKIALITLGATQLMNLAFIVPLKHAGLALSIGLASLLNAALLYRGLRRRGVYRPQPRWGIFTLRLLVALAVLGVVLWFGMGDETWWYAQHATTRALRLSAVVLGGIAAYFLTLFALGIRLRDFRRRAA